MKTNDSGVDLHTALDIAARRLSAAAGTGHRPVCYLPGNAGRIDAIEQWIFEHPERLRGVDLFQVLALGPAAGWERAVMGGVGIVTPFIGPGVRRLVNAGLARNIRCHLSQVPRLFEERWRPEVAFAHTSAPDEHGRVTLGLNAGIDHAPLRHAAFKVAIVNPQLPRWHIAHGDDPASGQRFEIGCAMALGDFDLVVEHTAAPLEHAAAPSTPAVDAEVRVIARRVVDLLQRDADEVDAARLPHTIQLGIGRIPDAVAAELAARRIGVRGVWSEMFSDGVLGLYRDGLVAGIEGPALRERIVVGFVLGSRSLYETMHDNPHFAVLPQELVNDPALIRHNPRMTSINTALAVSLAGEVAAATIDRRYYSDVGGQFDFALGASWARGGTAIIALPSVVRLRDGALGSRIVASHAEGAHHTIGADLPVVVVTEQGVADLRALNDTERVEAMVDVAHAGWRAPLAKAARTLPSMQGVGTVAPRLIALADGRTAIARAAGRHDIGAIRTYIERLSAGDRYTRYMGSVAVHALIAEQRLARLYDETLDHRGHAAFVVECGGEIVGVAHAFRVDEGGAYEVSFSRRSDLRGRQVGTHLMHMLIEWGVAVGAGRFEATTYRNRNPRMRALFDRFGFASRTDPDDFESVRYAAYVADLARAAPGVATVPAAPVETAVQAGVGAAA